MNKLSITYLTPESLQANPWNPNEVDPINQEKIVNSLRKEGFFKPILVRELADGTLEILGGEHRRDAAIELGEETVPVLNLGQVDDAKAKRMTLLDNGQYGENNFDKMVALFENGGMGTMDEIMSIMPFDESEVENYFSHDTLDADLAALDNMDEDDGDDTPLNLSPAPIAKTSQVLRFKVNVIDAEWLTDLVKKTQAEQGYTQSDDLTNAGDALVHLLRHYKAVADE
jgi:ParB-like chromosome segregation protein Spo0J